MTDNDLWEKFAVSGKVEDYLLYAAHKDTENDNIRGYSDKGASCG